MCLFLSQKQKTNKQKTPKPKNNNKKTHKNKPKKWAAKWDTIYSVSQIICDNCYFLGHFADKDHTLISYRKIAVGKVSSAQSIQVLKLSSKIKA